MYYDYTLDQNIDVDVHVDTRAQTRSLFARLVNAQRL